VTGCEHCIDFSPRLHWGLPPPSHFRGEDDEAQVTWAEGCRAGLRPQVVDPCLEPCSTAWLGMGPPEALPLPSSPPCCVAKEGGALGQSRELQPVPRNVGLWAVCFGSSSALSSPSLLVGPPPQSAPPAPTHCLPCKPQSEEVVPSLSPLSASSNVQGHRKD
jgi:hypothetical protein